MQQMTISGIKIDVIRKDIKNMHLAVYPPQGRVRIAAPFSVTDDAVRLYAVSKLSWIKKQQRKFQDQERQTPREYKNRESHYFLGVRYLLHVFEADAPPQVRLKNKTVIELHVRPQTSTAGRRQIMNQWYRDQLKKLIPELIAKWEAILNVQVGSWQVRLMKTKWGSCIAEKKKIGLNLELAKKPVQCLEYIIVHEMIHLIERHHNAIFLNLLDIHLPNWKQLKAELNSCPIAHADWRY